MIIFKDQSFAILLLIEFWTGKNSSYYLFLKGSNFVLQGCMTLIWELQGSILKAASFGQELHQFQI